MFKIFDTTQVEEFAKGLAEDLGRRFPPASESRTDPGAKHQVSVILEGLSARATRFSDQNKLGIYKKAKLANVFKWRLSELGYTATFVDTATKALATRVAASRDKAKAGQS